MSLRIFLIDDHPIVREGIRRLIDREHDMTLCGESDGDEDIVRATRELAPDIVILDLSLPNANGLDLIQDIRAQLPDQKILILSMHDEKLYAERAIRAGAMGYIMKQEASKKVVEGLRTVASGRVYASAEITRTIVKGAAHAREESIIATLSDREFQVFQYIGEGHTLQEIAAHLTLSIKTIESHVERTKTKLGIQSGRELMRRAIEWNLRSQGPTKP